MPFSAPDDPVAARERSLHGSRRPAGGRAARPVQTILDVQPEVDRRATSGRRAGRRGGVRARRARRHDDPGRRRHGRAAAAAERVRTSADGDARGRRPDDRRWCSPMPPRRRCSPSRASSTTRCSAAQATLGELATIWREQPVPSAAPWDRPPAPRGPARAGSGGRSSDGWPRRRSFGRSPRPTW